MPVIPVGDAKIELDDEGTGDPVVLLPASGVTYPPFQVMSACGLSRHTRAARPHDRRVMPWPMAVKTRRGSCHCGAVRFEADIDLVEGTMRCNCSHCWKARTWFTLVAPDRFRLLSGAGAESEYQWSRSGGGPSNLHFRFCSTCGIRTPGYGEHGPSGGPFWFIPIAALDDVDPRELVPAASPYEGRYREAERSRESSARGGEERGAEDEAGSA